MHTVMAGTARNCITPPVGVRLPPRYTSRDPLVLSGKHDELWARAVVFESGPVRVGIVAVDLMDLREDHISRIASIVHDAAGIPPENLLVACSHTHSAVDLWAPYGRRAPPWLGAQLELIGGAVCRAAAELRPVGRMRWATGSHTGLAYNRRLKLDEVVCMHMAPLGSDGVSRQVDELATALGVTRAELGVPPGPVPATGPVDAQIGVLAIDDAAGLPIVTFVNLACHPVTLSFADRKISAEYPGRLVHLVERELGGTALFLQGCCGDVRPKYDASTYSEVVRSGWAFGSAVLSTLCGLSDGGILSEVACSAESVTLRLRPHMTQDQRQRRRAVVQAALADARATPCGPGNGVGERWRMYQEGAELSYQLRMGDYEVSQMDRRREAMTALVQAIRLGDFVLCGLPGEIFASTGMALREWSLAHGYRGVLQASNANGFVGYVPPADEARRGGYEASATMLADDACNTLVDGWHRVAERARHMR